MTATARDRIFRMGWFALFGDIALYVLAMIHIRKIAEDTAKLANTLHIAATYFVYGSLLALVALVLVLFGCGRKKLPASLAWVAMLPFWYGLTMY